MNDHIIGATTARPGQFSYMARIWRHRFGGTIISNRWILSAAHQTNRLNAGDLRIVVGAHLIQNGGRA